MEPCIKKEKKKRDKKERRKEGKTEGGRVREMEGGREGKKTLIRGK